MSKEFSPSHEVKQYLAGLREEANYARPSIYFLESYADKLMEIANKWQAQTDESIVPLISILMDLDIFRADLGGELQHDYDKNNKRYRGKWLIEKSKLDSIRYKLITEYEKIQSLS